MKRGNIIDDKHSPVLPRHLSFGWNVAVIAAGLSERLDGELRSVGLSINHWPTLFALWEQDGLTQSELTNRCNTAHYTTTRLLDSLEMLELVERRPHPTSRRSHMVYLTDKGRGLEEKAVAKAKEVNKEFLSALSQDEQKQLSEILLKIICSHKPEIKESITKLNL